MSQKISNANGLKFTKARQGGIEEGPWLPHTVGQLPTVEDLGLNPRGPR